MPIVEPEVTLGPGTYGIEETAYWWVGVGGGGGGLEVGVGVGGRVSGWASPPPLLVPFP